MTFNEQMQDAIEKFPPGDVLDLDEIFKIVHAIKKRERGDDDSQIVETE